MKVGIDDYLVQQKDPATALQVLLDAALVADPLLRARDVAKSHDPAAAAVKLLHDLSFAAAMRVGGASVLDVIAKELRRSAHIRRAAVEDAVENYTKCMSKASRPDAEQPAGSEAEDATQNPPLRGLRGEVTEGPGGYYVKQGDDDVRVSSFLIRPKMRVNLDGVETVVADIQTDAGSLHQNIYLGPEVWRSRKDFLPALGHLDCQWSGSDQNLQGVRRLVAQTSMSVRTGTRALGYVETEAGPLWVAPNIVIGPDGEVPDPPLIYVPHGPGLHDRLRYTTVPPADARSIAGKVLPLLIRLNDPAVILPIIGWFYATPFRPRIVKLIGHFPILVIWGGAGSGKTTIAKTMWRHGGVADSLPYGATGTDFTFMKLLSDSESVPVFMDEYKPADMPPARNQFIIRLLRRSYGGETEERGRADRKVDRYRVSAPIVIAGESRPDGGRSLGERMISVVPNRNLLEGDSAYGAVLAELDQIDGGQLALPYIQSTLGEDAEECLEGGRQYAEYLLSEAKMDRPLPPRCRDNLAIMAMGLLAFRRFAGKMDVALPEFDAVPAVTAVVSDVADGDAGPKDGLDLFLENLTALARNEGLIEGRHYASINGRLNIHLRSCHEVYLEHVRRTGATDATNGFPALRRLVRENQERNGYVVEASHPVELDGGRVRCVEIDLKRAQEVLDVDDFPSGANRRWGGCRSWDRDEEG